MRETGYERINSSEISDLTELDFDLLTRCVLIEETSRLEAVREFRREIQVRSTDREKTR